MSNEARITTTLNIRKGNLDYTSNKSFQADVATAKGPSPGAISVDTTGEAIDLSELTTPTLCRFTNLSSSGTVEVGITDPQLATFWPMIELLPGESYIVRLSSNLNNQYGTGTGTGTSDATVNNLWARAITGTVILVVEAFEL